MCPDPDIRAAVGGLITDRDGGPADLLSDAILAGSPAAHADFLRLTAGIDWRGG